MTTLDIIVQSTFKYLISNSSYAKKIAMLQAANSTDAGQPSTSEFSGFAPPLMFRSNDVVAPVQSQEAGNKAKSEESSSTGKWGPIVGQFILPDFKADGSPPKNENKVAAVAVATEGGESRDSKSIVVRFVTFMWL